MNVRDDVILQPRLDDYSYQVCSLADDRFWFCLVRESDIDIITDYFIGSRPKESAGSLLSRCYTVLGLTPDRVIVFRDILVSKIPHDPMILRQARDRYTEFGRALLGVRVAAGQELRLAAIASRDALPCGGKRLFSNPDSPDRLAVS